MDAGLQNYLAQSPQPQPSPKVMGGSAREENALPSNKEKFQDLLTVESKSPATINKNQNDPKSSKVIQNQTSATDIGIEESSLETSKLIQSPGTLAGIVGNGEQAIAKSPILAVLTGKIDSLQLESIPKLITGNSFLQSALGGDASQVMNTELPVLEIIEMFGFDQSTVDLAVEQGLNLNEPMKINDFLKMIGIDPHQVLAEIERLRHVLPKEGITGFIRPFQNNQQGLAPLPSESDTRAVEGLTEDEKLEASLLANSAQPMGMALSGPPPMVDGSEDQTKAFSQIEDNNHGPLGRHKNQPVTPVLKENEPYSGNSGLSDVNPQKLGISKDLVSQNKIQDLSTGMVDAKVMKAERVAYDPYESLTPQMVDRNIHSVGIAAQTAGLDGSRKPLFSPGNEILSRLAFDQKNGTDFVTLTEPQIANGDMNSDIYNKLSQGANGSHGLKTTNSLDGTLVGLDKVDPNLGVIPGFVTSSASDGELTSDDWSHRGDEQGEGGGKKSLFHDNASSQAKFSPGLEGLGQRSIQDLELFQTEDVGPQLAETVVQRARMMVKEGGGSVVIDLGSNELGQMALAMQVDGDKVSLRLISQSENMRAVFGGEIGRLQEALAAQNLQLVHVETGGSDSGRLGQHGNQNWSMNHQNFGGFNERSKSWFDESRPEIGNKISGFSPQIMRQFLAGPSTRGFLHGSQIQVLA